jgi:hypothetical protein
VGRDITTLPLHLAVGEEATTGVVATGVVRLSLLGFLRQLTTFYVHAGPPAQPPAALWRCKGAGRLRRPEGVSVRGVRCSWAPGR